jgi:hypothetical protein
MSITPYKDEVVPLEIGERYGAYVRSYATEHHRVEVHLFKKDARVTAFVTKSTAVAVAEAHAAVEEAVEAYTRSLSLPPGPRPAPADVVYDGYSLGRSGSI